MSEPREGGKGCCESHSTTVGQTLGELDFERGIWTDALDGNVPRIRTKLHKEPDCANFRDVNGFTPLHYASRAGHLEAVRVLVKEGGADVNARSPSGKIGPLHRAAYMGRISVLLFLLDNGGDPFIKDADGCNSLHKACERKSPNNEEIFRILKERHPRLLEETHAKCPVCDAKVLLIRINEHLDGKDCKPKEKEDSLFPDEDLFSDESLDSQPKVTSSSSIFKRPYLFKGGREKLESLGASISPSKKRPKREETNDERVKPYYLANFETMIRGILEECPDDAALFTAEEISFVTEKFQKSCSLDAQKLYVRLFQRKWTWVSSKSMSYSEIKAVDKALIELKDYGLVEDHTDLEDLSTVLNLLSAPFLKNLSKDFNLNKTNKKDILSGFEKLLTQKTFFNKAGTNDVLKRKILKKALAMLDPCYMLTEESRRLFNRILSLYSLTHFYDDREGANNAGNSNLTTMFLANRGNLIFPEYEILRKLRIFYCREDLLAFERALEFEGRISELFGLKEFAEICDDVFPKVKSFYEDDICKSRYERDNELPDFLRKFTAGGVTVYSLSKCAEAYEKIRDYESAVNLYALCLKDDQIYLKSYSGHWYDRLTVDLEQHLKKKTEAVEWILKALDNCYVSPARKLGLCQRLLKIHKSQKLEIEFKKLNGWIDPVKSEELLRTIEIQGCMLDKEPLKDASRGRGKSVFVIESSDEGGGKLFCSVEEFTREHFRNEYPLGVHGEGAVTNSIVFVVFWDIVYDYAVPDAFRGPFQHAPLDLDYSNFYSSRKDQLEARIQFINTELDCEFYSLLERNWNKGVGTSSLVTWDLFSSEYSIFEGLVRCLTRKQISDICYRLIKNHRYFRSGFPDLTVWNPSDRKIKFIEVKGPGDKLSTKQIIWINFLNSINADAVVCHVRADGGKNR